MAYFLPDNTLFCMQGPRAYMEISLVRLKMSPVGSQYAKAAVSEGSCVQHSAYTLGPTYHRCFPGANIYHFNEDATPDNIQMVLMKDQYKQARSALELARAAGTKLEDIVGHSDLQKAEAEANALCDNGRMMQESFGHQSLAAPHSLKPRSGAFCLQGSGRYLQQALRRLQANDTDFQGAEVVAGGCALREATAQAGEEVPCLPHATLYLAADSDSAHATALAAAKERAQAACGLEAALGAAPAEALLREPEADWVIGDETSICWQGPPQRLEEVRAIFLEYGLPQTEGDLWHRPRQGSCEKACGQPEWEERTSCIKHMRQCWHSGNMIARVGDLAQKSGNTPEKIVAMFMKTDLKSTCMGVDASAPFPLRSWNASAFVLHRLGL